MWFKEFKDYPIDKPLKKETVTQGPGLIGCEMKELNGWGESYTLPKKPAKKGFLRKFLTSLFSRT
jgi:hypothetical protein